MRDYLLFALVFGLLPFILKRPVIGVLAYTWISLMNPHRLTYGAAYDFPFAAIVAGTTFVGLILTREPRRLPFTPVIVTLILFLLWTTVTSFFAMNPDPAWQEWNQVLKMILMAMVAVFVLNSKQDINAFSWVVALSLGFYGLKGGIFTLLSGGSNNVFGPQGTNIGDNNDLALALVTTLPIIWHLHLHSSKRWLRLSLKGLAFFTLIAAVGTYSRGALLAGSAMLFLLWLKNGHKLRNGFVLAMVPLVVFALMPDKWFNRMESISEYKDDASAMGRINAWQFAINVARENFMGGGFRNFTPEMFLVYAPNPQDFHAPHSIYFQVLGNHGFIGLALFVLLMILAWRTGSRIVRTCKANARLNWASNLAAMLQASLVGYAVGGAFLSLAYFDFYYDVVALLIALEKVVSLKMTNTGNARLPPVRSQYCVPNTNT
jgi:probable O-glycosylation ligase (exosortase A-associated)